MNCFRCGKKPSEIDEYVEAAMDEGISPERYVQREEGTFNPKSGQFCCTDCYIEIGMPANAIGGWRAP